MNGAGDKVHQDCGSKEAEAFIMVGKSALAPETQLISYQSRYNQGDRDFNFLREYARTLTNANMENEEVMTELISSDRNMELISKRDFELLANSNSIQSKSFGFIVDHRDQFKANLDKGMLDDYLYQTFIREAHSAGKAGDWSRLTEAQKFAEKCLEQQGKKLVSEMNWTYSKASKSGIFEAAQAYADGYLKDNSEELNDVSWTIFENYSDAKSLTAAATWAQRSVKLSENFANLDTYANILFKLGKNTEAAKYARLSIEAAKKEQSDFAATEELLHQIEAAQIPGKK